MIYYYIKFYNYILIYNLNKGKSYDFQMLWVI